MAKRKRTARRPARQPRRETNWLVIGGVVVAVLAVLGLLALALREPAIASLAEYCAEEPDKCIVNGPEDAPVTIIEVSDYGCPACRDFNVETAGLIEDLYVTPGDVRWVILPFASSAGTVPVASAAVCAEEQGRFFEFHRRLFETQPSSLEQAGYTAAAEDVGLEMTAFNSCVNSERYQDAVEANIRAASQAGVRVTPSFYINGKKLEGNQPLPTFQQEIARALEVADAN